MNKNIYNEKAIQNAVGPEKLDDYIKVSNPSSWVVGIAIIIFIAGFLIWSIFGSLEEKKDCVVKVEKGNATVYILDRDFEDVSKETVFTINEKNYEVEKIYSEPVQVSVLGIDSYQMHLGDLKEDDWVCRATAKTELLDGTYQAKVLLYTINPIEYILN